MALSREVDAFEMAQKMLNDETLGNTLALATRINGKWRPITLIILRGKEKKGIFSYMYKGAVKYVELGHFKKVFIGRPDLPWGEEEEDKALEVFFS